MCCHKEGSSGVPRSSCGDILIQEKKKKCELWKSPQKLLFLCGCCGGFLFLQVASRLKWLLCELEAENTTEMCHFNRNVFVCWLHLRKQRRSNTFLWSLNSCSFYPPAALRHAHEAFYFSLFVEIRKIKGEKRTLSRACGGKRHFAAELSSFGSRLHKLTESCTQEESASYQSALSGLPWYSSSSVDLSHNEGWLSTHCTLFLHTVVMRNYMFSF